MQARGAGDKRALLSQGSRGLRAPEEPNRFRAAGTLVPCRCGRVAGVRVEPTEDGRPRPKRPPLPSHTGISAFPVESGDPWRLGQRRPMLMD